MFDKFKEAKKQKNDSFISDLIIYVIIFGIIGGIIGVNKK